MAYVSQYKGSHQWFARTLFLTVWKNHPVAPRMLRGAPTNLLNYDLREVPGKSPGGFHDVERRKPLRSLRTLRLSHQVSQMATATFYRLANLVRLPRPWEPPGGAPLPSVRAGGRFKGSQPR